MNVTTPSVIYNSSFSVYYKNVRGLKTRDRSVFDE